MESKSLYAQTFSPARLLSPRAAELLIPMSSSTARSRPIPPRSLATPCGRIHSFAAALRKQVVCAGTILKKDLSGKIRLLMLSVRPCFLSVTFFQLPGKKCYRKRPFFSAMDALKPSGRFIKHCLAPSLSTFPTPRKVDPRQIRLREYSPWQPPQNMARLMSLMASV